MFGLGLPEIVIVIVVIVILFLGADKIKDFAHGLGRFSGEYKKGRAEIEKELRKIQDESK